MKFKTRINPIVAMFMLGTALIYDGAKAFIELITFGFLGWIINPFINFWATMTFWFWFTFLGVKFMKSGKMLGAKIAGMSAPTVIGLLPWVGSLPHWTSGVYVNLVAVYVEDLLEALTPETLSVMASIARKAGKKAKTGPSTPTTGAPKDKPKQKTEGGQDKKKTEETKKKDGAQGSPENNNQPQKTENKNTENQNKEANKKETTEKKEEDKPKEKTDEREKSEPGETEPVRDHAQNQENQKDIEGVKAEKKDEKQSPAEDKEETTEKEKPEPGETEPVRDHAQNQENQTSTEVKKVPTERENFANYLDEKAKRKRQEQGYPEYNEDLGEIVYPDEDDEDWPMAV